MKHKTLLTVQRKFMSGTETITLGEDLRYDSITRHSLVKLFCLTVSWRNDRRTVEFESAMNAYSMTHMHAYHDYA